SILLKLEIVLSQTADNLSPLVAHRGQHVNNGHFFGDCRLRLVWSLSKGERRREGEAQPQSGSQQELFPASRKCRAVGRFDPNPACSISHLRARSRVRVYQVSDGVARGWVG